MRIHYLQHMSFEDAGYIALWARTRGHTVTRTRLYRNETLPSQGSFDWLVVMGGPMSIHEHDAHPWLVAEKRFIRETVDRGIPYLGVCLGAQLAADVLGGRVMRNPHKEIGWFPVHWTARAGRLPLFRDLPGQFLPFHWHGDTFSIPPGATRIAYSDACANQAFLYGSHVLGLQFHLDYSVQGIKRMIRHCGDELVEQPTIQTRPSALAHPTRVQRARHLLYRLLDSLHQQTALPAGAGDKRQ